MKTVNEIALNMRTDFRSEKEQSLLIDTFREVLAQPEQGRVRGIVDRVRRKNIRNLGEQGTIELVGAVGIFLTQVPENKVWDVEREHYIRCHTPNDGR